MACIIFYIYIYVCIYISKIVSYDNQYLTINIDPLTFLRFEGLGNSETEHCLAANSQDLRMICFVWSVVYELMTALKQRLSDIVHNDSGFWQVHHFANITR